MSYGRWYMGNSFADAEELSRSARLATRYVFESEVLLTYVMLIAGKPSRN